MALAERGDAGDTRRVAWELWASDYFDRETPPSCDARGEALEDGLAALWRKTLEEGIGDDGRPTFTWFMLRVEGRPSFEIPRDPQSNPVLARLRRLRGEPSLVLALARLHTRNAGAEVLAMSAVAADDDDLRFRLGLGASA